MAKRAFLHIEWQRNTRREDVGGRRERRERRGMRAIKDDKHIQLERERKE